MYHSLFWLSEGQLLISTGSKPCSHNLRLPISLSIRKQKASIKSNAKTHVNNCFKQASWSKSGEESAFRVNDKYIGVF